MPMVKSSSCASIVFQLMAVLYLSTSDVLSKTVLSDLYSDVYSTFKTLERALVQDKEQLHILRQAFFPIVVNRFWSVDDVVVVEIYNCLHFSSSDNISAVETDHEGTAESQFQGIRKCWKFQWTNSQLMSITSADVLEAMEPAAFTILYSDVVGSLDKSRAIVLNLTIPLAELPCNTCIPSDHELTQALGLLFSWAKAYAISDGIPSQWEPQHQGYVTRWYVYTSKEPFYISIIYNDKSYYIALWMTFAFLNILIPFMLYTRGNQLTQILSKSSRRIYQEYPAVFQASAGLIIFYNMLYLVAMIATHVYGGRPAVLECILSTTRHKCRIPPTAYFNSIIIGVLITKIALFSSGVLIELAAAVKITRQLYPSFRSSRKIRVSAVAVCFVIWNCLVFFHIVLGLGSIPMFLFFIISPMHTFLVTGLLSGMIVFLVTLTASVIHAKLWNLKSCKANLCTFLENLLVLGLVFAVFATYYMVVKGGVNMSTIKGTLLTLLPTLSLPVLTWMVKKKLYAENETLRTKPSPITDSTMELLKMEETS